MTVHGASHSLQSKYVCFFFKKNMFFQLYVEIRRSESASCICNFFLFFLVSFVLYYGVPKPSRFCFSVISSTAVLELDVMKRCRLCVVVFFVASVYFLVCVSNKNKNELIIIIIILIILKIILGIMCNNNCPRKRKAKRAAHQQTIDTNNTTMISDISTQ
jgi:hypothetical protein